MKRRSLRLRRKAQAILTRAKAQAEANRIVSDSLSGPVLELERLRIQKIQAEAWDGALPSTVLGEGANLLFEME